uniref:RING-type domain-containing protein n=1 Tax=Timema monikensis TaxID=170555 RepID=A0A7R9EEG2_9NEOP|nr:unnamed protein product [Timema monikensis]
MSPLTAESEFESGMLKGPHGDKLLTVFLPQQALDLGTPPRLCYPLVIFLVRNDQGSTHPDETVALINVIHIKDLVCTLPTSILAQYLKQANGQLSCLKQLYLATGLSYEDESNTTAVPQLSQEEQLCVVCQYFPLSRALLPCRHTCICASCFIKVDRCPMCRSPIRSYFCVRGEEYMPGEPAGTSNKKPTPLMQWLLDWNDHLTDFLGFQRGLRSRVFSFESNSSRVFLKALNLCKTPPSQKCMPLIRAGGFANVDGFYVRDSFMEYSDSPQGPSIQRRCHWALNDIKDIVKSPLGRDIIHLQNIRCEMADNEVLSSSRQKEKLKQLPVKHCINMVSRTAYCRP